jgi:hypothetical protein
MRCVNAHKVGQEVIQCREEGRREGRDAGETLDVGRKDEGRKAGGWKEGWRWGREVEAELRLEGQGLERSVGEE